MTPSALQILYSIVEYVNGEPHNDTIGSSNTVQCIVESVNGEPHNDTIGSSNTVQRSGVCKRGTAQ